MVNLVAVTDSYQTAENRFKITRYLLEVFLKLRNALLVTKSDFILRDLDFFKQIGQTGFLNVTV